MYQISQSQMYRAFEVHMTMFFCQIFPLSNSFLAEIGMTKNFIVNQKIFLICGIHIAISNLEIVIGFPHGINFYFIFGLFLVIPRLDYWEQCFQILVLMHQTV